MKPSHAKREPWVSTTNPCHQCRPLGAALAFRGVEGCIPFLHGSQGCATYMRRYLISHFREPIDIASSSMAEKEAVFGGGRNLRIGLRNVSEKYGASVIGLATTCLTETTGEDMGMLVHEWEQEILKSPLSVPAPEIVRVSTPSYDGTHAEGFHGAVRALVEHFAEPTQKLESTLVLPGPISPEDMRLLKRILESFSLPATMLPDYSDSLDGPARAELPSIPPGGTTISDLRKTGSARAVLEFGRTASDSLSAGDYLHKKWGVEHKRIGLPVGLRATDNLMSVLEAWSGMETPEQWQAERGRLVDACVDSHKYISGKRAVVFGDEDTAAGIVGFLTEIGIQTVLVVSGGRSGALDAEITRVTATFLKEPPLVLEDADFRDLAERADAMPIDLMVGHSKGYAYARRRGIPLVRAGFPIHDRFGGQRLLHIGYGGALQLLDRIVNTLLEAGQEESTVGYAYL